MKGTEEDWCCRICGEFVLSAKVMVHVDDVLISSQPGLSGLESSRLLGGRNSSASNSGSTTPVPDFSFEMKLWRKLSYILCRAGLYYENVTYADGKQEMFVYCSKHGPMFTRSSIFKDWVDNTFFSASPRGIYPPPVQTPTLSTRIHSESSQLMVLNDNMSDVDLEQGGDEENFELEQEQTDYFPPAFSAPQSESETDVLSPGDELFNWINKIAHSDDASNDSFDSHLADWGKKKHRTVLYVALLQCSPKFAQWEKEANEKQRRGVREKIGMAGWKTDRVCQQVWDEAQTTLRSLANKIANPDTVPSDQPLTDDEVAKHLASKSFYLYKVFDLKSGAIETIVTANDYSWRGYMMSTQFNNRAAASLVILAILASIFVMIAYFTGLFQKSNGHHVLPPSPPSPPSPL